MRTLPKIVIIGAGAAGLAAASLLLENGINDILILEAENRIGGRVYSVQFGDGFVDLGGQWCHGEKNNVVFEMVKDLDLLSFSKNDYTDNTYYLSDGTIIDKSTSDSLWSIADQIWEDEEMANDYDGSFGQYFIERYNEEVSKNFPGNKEVERIAKILLDWFHKFHMGLDALSTWFDVSAKGCFSYQKCEGNNTLNWRNKGYKTVLDVLLKKLPDPTKQLPIDDKIFLNMEVNRIVWDHNTINPGGVTIECSDGSSFNADLVLVTVSLGVLKENYKTLFSPELPEYKQTVIECMGYGTVNKILLKFPEQWWPKDCKGFSLVWTEDDRRNILKEFPYGPHLDGKSWLEDVYGFYPIDSNPRVLLGWVVGKLSAEVELQSDEIVTDGCMYLLRKFVGDKFDIPSPDGVLRSNWASNPHFRGSYHHVSMAEEKQNVSAKNLEQPLISSDDKQIVLFAGEATHSSFYSTVHGALETGFREAHRIINIYK